jgi:hypothetical protein
MASQRTVLIVDMLIVHLIGQLHPASFVRIGAADNFRRLSSATKPASRATEPPMPQASAAMRHFRDRSLKKRSSLRAGLHAHPILGFAGRTGLILHAGLLLVSADPATRLRMCGVE